MNPNNFDSFFENAILLLGESPDQMDLFAWGREQEEKRKAAQSAQTRPKPRPKKPVVPVANDIVAFDVAARPDDPTLRDVARDKSLDWTSDSTKRTFTGFSFGAVPGSFRRGSGTNFRPIEDGVAHRLFGRNGRILVAVVSTRGMDMDTGETFSQRSDLIVRLENMMSGASRPSHYTMVAKVDDDSGNLVLVAPVHTHSGSYRKNKEAAMKERERQRVESEYGEDGPWWNR